MALEDLDPAALIRTIGQLAVAQSLITDVFQGRAATRAEVNAIRQAFTNLRRVLDALDEQAGWNSVPNTRTLIEAGDALAAFGKAADPPIDAALVTTWRQRTDPWRA
jgi:hypothetical protein